MNKDVIATRPLMYAVADGTGRDTHSFNLQYNEHDRNMAHYSPEKLDKFKTSLSPARKQRLPGVPQGEERLPIYMANGSGRDGYIHLSNAGLIPKYKPYQFGNDLR